MTFHQRSPDKIGYVCKRYPRFSETFIVNEILAHEAAGQEIEIFALCPVEETHFQDQISKVRAPVKRFADKLKRPRELWKLQRQTEATFPHSAKILLEMEAADCNNVAQGMMLALACREKGVRHLHAHFGTVATTVARIAATIAGITYSFTAHAKDIYHNYDEPLYLDVKLRDAASVVTVSDYNVNHLQSTFGPNAARVERIYNGIDLTRFTYSPPKPDATEILAVGRLVEKKGFHILLEAISIIKAQDKPVRCRIIGDGNEYRNLSAQISATGLSEQVTLAGPVSQPQVIAAMREAAVLACPCIVGRDGNRDGLPTVLLEAMALGTPCVATDVTGIPELIRDGETGLCIPEGNPMALVEALVRMTGDPALRTHVSRQGRRLIEAEYDITRNAARLRNVFAKAIASQEQIRGAA